MPKVLFISSFHPHAEGNIGAGEAICGHSLESLLSKGYDVDVIVNAPSRQTAKESVVHQCKSYTILDTNIIKAVLSIFYNFFNFSFLAPWFFSRVNFSVVKLMKKKIEQNDYDFIWLDFPSSLGFSCHIKNKKIIYFAHDIVFQRISRSILKRLFTKLVTFTELFLIRKCDEIFFLSTKDMDLVLPLLRINQKTHIVKDINYKVGVVKDSISAEELVKKFDDNRNAVFFGNMSRPENHWSIVFFIIFHFFRIKDKKLHFWIVGLSPKLSLILLSKLCERIHVTGAVDDPEIIFKKSDFCLVPLLFGAGVKIKVLQMLGAGSYVISTPVGAEGIYESSRLIISEVKYISKKIDDFLSFKKIN
tara:strand:- start:69390 stop:70472 length:1083 start_codon:yes stop_codon:yes gene_type:complete